MTLDDDVLMAHADGELDAKTRRALEQAMAADPALAARVQQHRALRQRVNAAFDPLLDEPVPERLQRALQTPTGTPAAVLDLARARAQRDAAEAAQAAPAPRRRVLGSWAQWGGMAASLLLGVLIARAVLPTAAGGVDLAEGGVPARGGLALALDQAASGRADAGAAVAVRLSFVDKQGRYCRAFEGSGQAGLACRDNAAWLVQALVSQPRGPSVVDGMRQAASALPPALLSEIDQRSAGEPLSAQAEREARQHGWRR